MTFQLSRFVAYGFEPSEPVTKRWRQKAIFTIAAANTDVALDISNTSGTFWTAAIADATYGVTVATPALQAIKDIVVRAEALNNVTSQELLTRTNAAKEPNITALLSAASVGGSATEAYTVTGLLTTDTILAVTPTVVPANAVYFKSFQTQIANGLSATYSGDPGAGAKITVAVSRVASGAEVTGQYIITTSGSLPTITWISGNAPTAYDIVIDWTLTAAMEPVELYVP